MRKLIPSLVVAVIVAMTFVSGASAHTTQASQTNQHAQLPSNAKPNASGGGCGSWNTNGIGDISAKACISYAYPYLQPDGYASFQRNQHGNIQWCRFRISVYENNSYLTRIDYNCSVAAAGNQKNVHFGPLSIFATGGGVSYYSVVQVNMEYQDGFFSACYPPASPREYL